MKLRLRQLTRLAPLLALFAVGCDALAYDDDVEGWYNYGGTVEDEPGYTVNGEVYITHQYSSSRAEADIQWFMYEGGRMILEIEAFDVPVYIRGDGEVSFDVVGDLQLASGHWTDFVLRHEGRVRGRTMRGEWELDTDAPSYDRGRFTASR